MKYTQKSFSIDLGSEDYRENFDRTFRVKKKLEKKVRCGECDKEYIPRKPSEYLCSECAEEI